MNKRKIASTILNVTTALNEDLQDLKNSRRTVFTNKEMDAKYQKIIDALRGYIKLAHVSSEFISDNNLDDEVRKLDAEIIKEIAQIQVELQESLK